MTFPSGSPYEDSQGNWPSGDFAERLADELGSECPGGCGMSSLRCICKPIEIRPYQTQTDMVREAEASVTPEDLEGAGVSWDDWQSLRQWTEDGTK